MPAPSFPGDHERSAIFPGGRPAWRHLPLRLSRRPAQFAALALGALLLTLAAAAAPLFVAASESELLTSTIADPAFTAYGAGIMYRATSVGFAEAQDRERAFVDAVGGNPVLGMTSASLAAPAVRVTDRNGDDPRAAPIFGRLFAGTDVLQHVHILSGTDGRGIWLPDYIADPLGARAGDVVQLHDGADTVRARVNGTFQAVYSAPADGYWRAWSHEIILRCPDCDLPPQFILADRLVLEKLQRALRRPLADQVLQAPVRIAPSLTPGEARAFAAFSDGLEASMQPGAGPLGELFRCCGTSFSEASALPSSQIGYINGMSGIVDILDQRSPGIRGPVQVLLLAGLVISLVAIAAAAAFVAASRRDETDLLRARGWSAARVGARSALEAALPTVVGAALGWSLAFLAVRAFGPNGTLGTDAPIGAAMGAIGAASIAMLTVGVTGGLMFVFGHEHKGRVGEMVAWLPWELLAFGGLWALAPTFRPGAGIATAGAIDQPRLAVFLFPLLLAMGVSILVVRAGLLLLGRRARSGGGEHVSAWYLAVRRLASSGRLTAIFFIAVSLAVTLSVSALGLLASIRATVDAKAKVFVGSDVRVEVVTGATPPSSFPLPVTQVQRAPGAGSFDENSGDRFDLLVVDPSTFEGAAFWNDSFSDRPLSQLMAALEGGNGGAVPIIIANDQAHQPSSITVNGVRAPVEIVGTASSFPGASVRTPLVVVAADAIEHAFHTPPYRVSAANASTELWIRGPTDLALAAAAAAVGPQTFFVLTADKVKDIPSVAAAVNTLRVIEVLGIVALLLIVVLVVAYLQARQRSRVVAMALSEQMGISPRLLRHALVAELGVVLTLAIVVGGAVGTFAIEVVLRAIAPLPTVPPPPFVLVPWEALIGVGILLLASAWLGAWVAERGARRTRLEEVMRVGG